MIMGNTLYGYSLAEHEYTVTVPKMYAGMPNEPTVVIAVSAHGGGTVGESYASNGWDYAVYVDGREVISGDDITSPYGRGSTHAEVAVTLAAFLSADAESLRYREAAEVSGDYDADAVAFLQSEGERLGIWQSEQEEIAAS